MNTETKTPATRTGRKYATVKDLLAGEGIASEVRAKYREIASETRITLHLARLRQAAGMTQEQMAEKLGVSQSAISKLESGRDEDLTLREVRDYSRATNQRIGMNFGKPYSHVEAVKLHALAIRDRLEALAKLANQHEEMEKNIKAFFGEAFFNLLDIMVSCGSQLPEDKGEVGIEIVKSGASPVDTNNTPMAAAA
jgi:transcriptional regulator with XRE-family HTH domain